MEVLLYIHRVQVDACQPRCTLALACEWIYLCLTGTFSTSHHAKPTLTQFRMGVAANPV